MQGSPFKIGPVTAITLEREFPRNWRFATDDDEQRLLDAADPLLRGVVIALLDTACRVSEALTLQWRSVSFERNELHFEGQKTKTRTARIVPISTRLRAVLEMRRHDPAGQPFGPDAFVFGNEVGERVQSVRKLWEDARESSGLARVQLRDLRHEAASRFDEAGVPTNYVSKLLGHTNLTTTSRYLNIHRSQLQLAMHKLEEHRSAKKAIAHGLHTTAENAPAVVPDGDAASDPKGLPS